MDELLNFKPKSQLVVERTNIVRSKYSVIDSHIHLCGRYRYEKFWNKYEIDDVVNKLKTVGINHVIDLELYSKKHWDFVMEQTEKYRDFVSVCAPICFDTFGDDFENTVLDEMIYYYKNGACGFKVWKNLGFSIRKVDGSLLKLTDCALKFIWEKAAKLKMPIVIHIGDPPAFFEPIDLTNERYFEMKQNERWNYANQSEVSYGDFLIQMQELLGTNPDTTFVIAHMASAAQNLDFVEKILIKYGNLYVDTAAVLSEIGRQPKRFRKLATKFQNRILFGTDYFAGDQLPYIPYFRFFETEDEYFSYTANGDFSQGLWNIYGCELDSVTLRLIYSENAKKVFGISR